MSSVRRELHLRRRECCTGKVKYRTLREAVLVARSANKALVERVCGYRCAFCGNSHVGRPPRNAHLPAEAVS